MQININLKYQHTGGSKMDKFLDYCTNTDLHATIILPGGCNAKCSFCYDISKNINNPNYINDL